MFHVKPRSPIGAYRSWRHTRFVRQWRPFFEQERIWNKLFAAAAPAPGLTQGQRVDALANQLRKALTRESR